MARTGWSASNLLRYGGAVVSAVPLSMCCWGYTSVSPGVAQAALGVFNSASANQRNLFRLGLTSTLAVGAYVADGAAQSNVTSSATASLNTWFHMAGTWSGANLVVTYLNGGSRASGTLSRTPSGLDRTSMGRQDNAGTDISWASGGTGYLAWPAIWNIALSDTDIAALAKGADPRLIHPEALIAFWPLLGVNSPENNLLSNAAVLSIVGSLSAANSPPIFRAG